MGSLLLVDHISDGRLVLPLVLLWALEDIILECDWRKLILLSYAVYNIIKLIVLCELLSYHFYKITFGFGFIFIAISPLFLSVLISFVTQFNFIRTLKLGFRTVLCLINFFITLDHFLCLHNKLLVDWYPLFSIGI